MMQSPELREKIRHILQALIAEEPHMIDQALERIMDVVDPLWQRALEELERFRPTFTDLAK